MRASRERRNCFNVGVVASMVAGCAVEVIDAHFEKRHDKRLSEIEQELDKLRQNKSCKLF